MDRQIGNLGILHNIGARVPSGSTKYGHLRSVILAAIDAGEWPVGGKLPAEQELAAFTGLSLGTVQRAMRELTAQGYLARRPGSGTFVLDRRKQMEEPLHCRFQNADTDGYLPVYSRLVSRGWAGAAGPWIEYLQHRDRGVVFLERFIDIGNAFSVHSMLYLSAWKFSRMLEIPSVMFDGVNIKMLLKAEFNVSVRTVKQKLRITKSLATPADPAGETGDNPALTIRAVGFTDYNEAVYYQELLIPPNDSWLVMEADV